MEPFDSEVLTSIRRLTETLAGLHREACDLEADRDRLRHRIFAAETEQRRLTGLLLMGDPGAAWREADRVPHNPLEV